MSLSWGCHDKTPQNPLLTSCNPHHLPKAPSPNNITWGVGLPPTNFAGDTVQSVSPCLPVFVTTAVLVPARQGEGQAAELGGAPALSWVNVLQVHTLC